MQMNTKYLPLALLIGCSPAAQSTKVLSPEPQKPDCSSLDLTQKVGFATSFTVGGEKSCYRIRSKENHYYDYFSNCDEQGMPLPERLEIMREFAGPKVGSMQMNYILSVSGKKIEYIPFWRDTSGKISTVPFAPIPEDLEDYFHRGSMMLDQAKNLPEVCQQLLEYKPVNQ